MPWSRPVAALLLFAAALLANHDAALRQKLQDFRARQTEAARQMTLPPH